MMRRRLPWLVSAGVLCLAGCVEGPFGGLPAVNPWLQKQWAKDEKFGPTFHRKLTDLRDLRNTVASLSPPKKDEIVADMTRLLPTEPNPVLRAEMARILGEAATPGAFPALQAALQDGDRDVRIAASQALAKFAPASAVPVLAQHLAVESDIDVRQAVIQELGRFQDPSVVAALAPALDDDNPAVQRLAVKSLQSATGRNYGDSVPAWREYTQGREPQLPPEPGVTERVAKMFSSLTGQE